jgi:hypothetical protein
VALEEKLLHNFHELDDRERLTYHVEIRPGLSAEQRFLFEGDLRCFGQLWVADRRALFDVVRRRRPRVCVEIGTFTGGGSTFFIASALKDNGAGMLISFEIDEPLHRLASRFYARCLPDLAAHVSFRHGPVDARALEQVRREQGEVDCVFLDGAEDEDQTVEAFETLRPFLSETAIVAGHDWNTLKMRRFKRLIAAEPGWTKLFEIGPSRSVGLAIFTRGSHPQSHRHS